MKQQSMMNVPNTSQGASINNYQLVVNGNTSNGGLTTTPSITNPSIGNTSIVNPSLGSSVVGNKAALHGNG